MATGGGNGGASAGWGKSEATQKELATLIGRTTRQVRNLTDEGVFQRQSSRDNPGQLVYPMPASINAWVEYQVAQRTKKLQQTTTDEAERRQAIADATLKELKVARELKDLVPRAEYRQELERILRRVREVIDQFEGKYAATLPGDSPMLEKVACMRRIRLDLLAELRMVAAPGEPDDETEAAA